MIWRFDFSLFDCEKPHRWFAWFPAELQDGRWVWLQTIWRFQYWTGGSDPDCYTAHALTLEGRLAEEAVTGVRLSFGDCFAILTPFLILAALAWPS